MSQNLIIMTAILGQWIFVYQYLKMACLMPFLLRQEDGDSTKKSFNGLTTKLALFNWSFVILTVVACFCNLSNIS